MNRAALTDDDRRMYRLRLQALVNRLRGDVAQLQAEALRPTGSEGTGSEGATHEPVAASTEGEQDVARIVLLTEDQILTEAYAALDRLDQGTFGRCERCGRGITRTRLKAVPYARQCIRCARTPPDDDAA